MAKKRVVIGQTSISAGQMQEFWAGAEKGLYTAENFQAYLERRNPWAEQTFPTTIDEGLGLVIGILGRNKVLTPEQSASAHGRLLGQPPSLGETIDLAVIRECAELNLAGEADWRFGFVQGFSLAEQRETFGHNRKRQPCFYDNDWWLEQDQASWARQRVPAGYQLINFKGQFGRMSWNTQEQRIAQLASCSRAHETVVSELAFGFFQANGERLLADWYHWGQSSAASGSRVCVGNFDGDGWIVDGEHPSYDADDYLRVCLSREFNLAV